MNIEQVDRLQGLLTRIEQNRERPRASLGFPWQRATGESAVKAVGEAPKAPLVLSVAEPLAPTISTEFVSEPLPLVTPLRPPPEPSPLEQALELEASAPPAPDSLEPPPLSAAATSKRPVLSLVEDIDDSELLDDADGEKLTAPPSAPTGAQAATASLMDATLMDVLEASEDVPDSGRRTREGDDSTDDSPDSLDAALSSAADSYMGEGPLLTPPPKSGDQLAIPTAPPAARSREDLAPQHGFSSLTPTSEQLGDVIDLEEAPSLSLELAELPPSEPPVAAEPAAEELEFVPTAAKAITAEPLFEAPPRETIPTLVDGAEPEAIHATPPTPPTAPQPESAKLAALTPIDHFEVEEPPETQDTTREARTETLEVVAEAAVESTPHPVVPPEQELDSGWGSVPPRLETSERLETPEHIQTVESSELIAASEPPVESSELIAASEPPVESSELIAASEPPIELAATTEPEAPVGATAAPTEILHADVIRRPTADGEVTVLAVLHAARGFRPTSLLELLDASLALGQSQKL